MTDAADEKENKSQHLHILMAPSEVEVIDEWGFKNRIRTRGETIRRLCQIGLVFDGQRVEIMELYVEAMSRARELVQGIRADSIAEMSAAERDLAMKAIDAYMTLNRVYAPLRKAHGLAKNFQDDRDILDIIAEAREILSPSA